MPPPQQQPSQDRQPVFDGQTDFSGGMDASRSPELINPNQIATGVNITVRGGYPQTRPQFLTRNLDFGGDDTAESYWHANLFQGYSYYNLNGFFPCLIASVGGHIFNLQPVGNDFAVTDITPLKADGVTLDPNSAWLFKAYFAVAATYLIIQDGQSLPYIFDGSTIRRSNPNVPEVPVGTIMAYGQARLVVGFGNQFLVGDILGGATNVISFTETTYLNGGGSFILPQNMGNITGMIFQAAQDTQTGQGGLLVFGETGCISVNLLIPREQWQATQIVTVTLTDIGTLSDRTLTTVNADVLFRSQDGIRSYRDARAEFGPYSVGNFGRTAMSYEVFQWLQSDFQQWLKFSSGVIFDNRYLLTTLPIMRTYGVPVFQAMVAMDFIAVNALRYNQPPVFDGFWTGPDIYQLATGNFFGGPRAFAATRTVDNAGNQQLNIMEITTNEGADNNNCPIQCSFETRSFPFGNLLTYKRINFLRHWADQIQQRVDWVLRIRPDQYPGWKFWQKWTDQAPVQTCQITNCSLPNYQPQYRAGRNSVLATEELTNDGSQLNTARTGFSFQLRLEWTGIARVTKFLLTAQPQDIPKLNALEACPPDDPLTAILGMVQPVTQYFNDAVTYTCPAGTTGTPVTIPAGTYSSFVSMADANSQALAAAMAAANCVTAPTKYLQFTFDPDINYIQDANFTFQISLDGGAFFAPTQGSMYQAATRFKYRIVGVPNYSLAGNATVGTGRGGVYGGTPDRTAGHLKAVGGAVTFATGCVRSAACDASDHLGNCAIEYDIQATVTGSAGSNLGATTGSQFFPVSANATASSGSLASGATAAVSAVLNFQSYLGTPITITNSSIEGDLVFTVS